MRRDWQAGFYLIRLRREGGGPAAATQSETAKKLYHFFDANDGHFVLNGAHRFQVWLAAGAHQRLARDSHTSAWGRVPPSGAMRGPHPGRNGNRTLRLK